MRSAILKGLSVLWISLITMNCSQGMWINLKGEKIEKSQIESKVIKEKNPCLVIDVSLPKLRDKRFEDINYDIDAWTNSWIDDVKSVVEDYKKQGYQCNSPYQLYAKYYLTREDKKLVSFYIDYYQFTGGAHGMTTRRAYNLDIDTANILKLSMLFKSGFNYKKIIDNEIKRQINNNKEQYFENGNLFKGIDDNTLFYIKGNDLVIYYGLYEIAPYAGGIQEFHIPIEKFEGNFIYGKI